MLKVYNTLTRQKEEFQPRNAPQVGVYACGVTVYDECHLGHARTYVSIDLIIRYLRFKGFQVKYVRNITDIDDKIIQRAHDNNESYQAVTERNIKIMHEDFAALNLTPPDEEPRATQYVAQMIALIQKIIEKKHAYVGKNGDVFFDVKSFAAYGALSHHNLDELESGARVEISEVKKDPLDFVLWKVAKPNEPFWDSPWGAGRPGWHIECSAMSMALLGEEFDLHLGGLDLIFPHHENEIAQSCSATEKSFAKYWMHGGFLQIEKEKMSKSLKNFVTIRDILREHNAEVLRFLLVSSHYRSPLVYLSDSMQQAKQALSRFYTALRFLPPASSPANSDFERKFIAAMDDDFNTPVALSILFDLAHEIQRWRDKDISKAASYAALLKQLAGMLGLLQADPEAFFQSGDPTLDITKIESLIKAREGARLSKNWSEADRIREELADMSITIEDGPNGTTWKSNK